MWRLHLLKIYEGLRVSIVVQLRHLKILSQGVSELPGKALEIGMKKRTRHRSYPIFEKMGHTIL